MTLGIDIQHNTIECHYAECRDYLKYMFSVIIMNVVMLSVVMLSVVMLSVVRLNVVMLSVVAMFVSGRSFQPILMFTGKIKSLPKRLIVLAPLQKLFLCNLQISQFR